MKKEKFISEIDFDITSGTVYRELKAFTGDYKPEFMAPRFVELQQVIYKHAQNKIIPHSKMLLAMLFNQYYLSRAYDNKNLPGLAAETDFSINTNSVMREISALGDYHIIIRTRAYIRTQEYLSNRADRESSSYSKACLAVLFNNYYETTILTKN